MIVIKNIPGAVFNRKREEKISNYLSVFFYFLFRHNKPTRFISSRTSRQRAEQFECSLFL